jgi:hypothetical protein
MSALAATAMSSKISKIVIFPILSGGAWSNKMINHVVWPQFNVFKLQSCSLTCDLVLQVKLSLLLACFVAEHKIEN